MPHRQHSPLGSPTRLKRPPDYTSRPVRWRLFLWVAAVMLGLGMIDAARDAKTWKWLASLDQPPQEPLQNRLPHPRWRTAGDPAGTFVAVTNQDAANDSAVVDFDPAERAWASGWEHVVSRLTADEKALLITLLYEAHLGGRPGVSSKDGTDKLANRIAALWDQYDQAARQSLAGLSEMEKNAWDALLNRLHERVVDKVLPALKTVAEYVSLIDEQYAVLYDVEGTLRDLARRHIRDDTPVFRPPEEDIWFQEIARLGRARHDNVEAPLVAYVQLHNQPDEYRGKFVRVKGTVRSAYRTAAGKNAWGIKEYYVFVIQPDGGPDSPILVYALRAPGGFPGLDPRKAGGTRPGSLREQVEVTGVFFKRCAYAAEGGLFTAPLLIADVPKWYPQPPVDLGRAPITPLQFAAAAIAALLLAICVTRVLWKRTARQTAPAADVRHGGFVNLGALEVGPSTAEKLRELERDAREGQV